MLQKENLILDFSWRVHYRGAVTGIPHFVSALLYFMEQRGIKLAS